MGVHLLTLTCLAWSTAMSFPLQEIIVLLLMACASLREEAYVQRALHGLSNLILVVTL